MVRCQYCSLRSRSGLDRALVEGSAHSEPSAVKPAPTETGRKVNSIGSGAGGRRRQQLKRAIRQTRFGQRTAHACTSTAQALAKRISSVDYVYKNLGDRAIYFSFRIRTKNNFKPCISALFKSKLIPVRWDSHYLRTRFPIHVERRTQPSDSPQCDPPITCATLCSRASASNSLIRFIATLVAQCQEILLCCKCLCNRSDKATLCPSLYRRIGRSDFSIDVLGVSRSADHVYRESKSESKKYLGRAC
jgi:hypothetical protein